MQHGIPVLSTQALYPIPCLLGFLPIDCDQCEIIEEIYQENIRAGDRDALQLQKLGPPTLLANGKRVPGLKLDQPRLISLMHALVRFSHIAARDSFSTTEIHADTAESLGRTTDDYTLASLRYDLSKLRAKGFIRACRLEWCYGPQGVGPV